MKMCVNEPLVLLQVLYVWGPLLYEGSLFSDMYIHCVYVYMYHKVAVAPLYIGIVQVGQHRSHTFAKSACPWEWALDPKSVFTKG